MGYRVRQLVTALGPKDDPVEDSVLLAHLSVAQATLFRRLSPAEQHHAMHVLQACLISGHNEPELTQAALLHDVGKSQATVRPWHRVTMVLLSSICPLLLQRLAQREEALHVLLHHAELGAKLAAAAGTRWLACNLIRDHHLSPATSSLDADGKRLLAALQAADETS